jgi:hypothetical protein
MDNWGAQITELSNNRTKEDSTQLLGSSSSHHLDLHIKPYIGLILDTLLLELLQDVVHHLDSSHEVGHYSLQRLTALHTAQSQCLSDWHQKGSLQLCVVAPKIALLPHLHQVTQL